MQHRVVSQYKCLKLLYVLTHCIDPCVERELKTV